MLALTAELLELFEQQGTLLVPTRQRAAAVRLAYAAEQLSRGQRAWRTPQVLTPAAWLQQQIALADEPLRTHGRILRPAEEWVLWLHAAQRLTADAPLLSDDALAHSLRESARLVGEHGLTRTRLQRYASGDNEPQWLLRALADVEAAAAALGAIAAHQVFDLTLKMTPDTPLRYAGLDPLPRGWQRLLQACGARSIDAVATTVPAVVVAESEDAQLRCAARWCRQMLQGDPARRLLVVIPDLDRRRDRVVRTFWDSLCAEAPLGSDAQQSAFVLEGGEPLPAYPWIAQSLQSLVLLLRPVSVKALLDWLRSPFWVDPQAGERARIDIQLRERLHGDCELRDVLAALRYGPLADHEAARQLSRRLEQAAAQLPASPFNTQEWAERFQRALELLGCNAAVADTSLAVQLRGRWSELLEEFAEIGRAAGSLSSQSALAILMQLAAQQRFAPISGDSAVTLSSDRSHPVVRYDGIWVCQCDAERWPEKPDPDAFIPCDLQREAGLPSASATGQLQQARAQLAAWRQCAAQLRLSFAKQVDDSIAQPSSLLQDFATLGSDDDAGAGSGLDFAVRLRRLSSPTMTFDDDQGSAWSPTRLLPGGSRSLELQDTCGFRAFAELRLDAQAFEAARPGIDKRERGKLIHRALQEFWQQTRTHSELAALQPQALQNRIADCVARAGIAVSGPYATLDHVAARDRRREEARARRQLRRACDYELKRSAFSVVHTELSIAASIGAAKLRLRIDRIDELDDAGWALIDYKSGEATSGNHWLAERPRPVQLLVYLAAMAALDSAEPVEALASLHLGRKYTRFKAIGARAGRLLDQTLAPDARNWRGPNAANDWQAQRQLWIRRVGTLADAFLAGVAAPNPLNALSCRHCALTALCRRVERLQFLDEDDATLDADAAVDAAVDAEDAS